MALIVETLMAEDLDLGTSDASKSHPAGGSLLGHQISLSTFATVGASGEAYTTTWTPTTEISNSGIYSEDFTVPNAALGDKVLASYTALVGENLKKIGLFAAVSASNTVTVTLINFTGAARTIGAGTLSILVFRHR